MNILRKRLIQIAVAMLVGFVLGSLATYWWYLPWIQTKRLYHDLDQLRIDKINISHASLSQVIENVKHQLALQDRPIQFAYFPDDLRTRKVDRFIQTEHMGAGFLDGVCQVFDVRWSFVDDDLVLIRACPRTGEALNDEPLKR